MVNHLKLSRFGLLLPVFGIFLFFILYGRAAYGYPGGSKFDKNAPGFDWLHNYWCDLLDIEAQNGSPNTARAVAVVAMIILCASLAAFWLLAPLYFNFEKHWQKATQIAGTLSMAAALLLFSGFHETGIALSGFFGLIALAGTLRGLHSSGFKRFYRIGLFCVFLVLVNNFIYYTRIGLSWLAIIQKFSFAAFLGWIVWICLKVVVDQKPDS